jgi:arylsulfatase
MGNILPLRLIHLILISKKTLMQRFSLLFATVVAFVSCQQPKTQDESNPITQPGALDRTSLPIKEPSVTVITEMDAHKVPTPQRFEVKAPDKAPNIVIVLIDDIGFGHSSAFGGPISMPTLERLAKGGLKYNRFHTTALCSPTRVAILTGRNHHLNNAGAIMELATGIPGNTGVRPNSVCAPRRDAEIEWL